jgi:hypothetical protein
LAPGTFKLIAVRNAPTKTVVESFCSLKAPNHIGDVDMPAVGETGHATIGFIVFNI